MPRIPAFLLCAAITAAHAASIAGDMDPGATLPRLPAIRTQVRPVYPELAKGAGLEGLVVVDVLVDANGKAAKTFIRARQPRFVDLFDEAARTAVMATTYEPALDAKGERVATWVSQPINFTLSGEAATCKLDTAPHYPAEGRSMGMDAVIGMLVRLNDWGQPLKDSLKIIGREPANARLFDEPAKAAVLSARCRPRKEYGRDVPSYLALDVVFAAPVPPDFAPGSALKGQPASSN
jgi:TonB family protein